MRKKKRTIAASENISVNQLSTPKIESGAKMSRNEKKRYQPKYLILSDTEDNSVVYFSIFWV
jgi:hypothetical protein